jgi:glycosyltransferase involved in cell wall biosynthesis
MEVSVIIPVYNRAEIVAKTLESVLAQTYRPLQVVLVDNCSTDGTLEVLNAFKDKNNGDGFSVTVVQESLHTAGAARNRGFEQATGDWVMFFDSDDTMEKHLVEKYVEKIDLAGGNCDIVAAGGFLVGTDGKKSKLPFFTNDLIANHILHSILPTQRYIVRREFFASTDGWNINLPGWNDWELGMRLLLARPRIGFLHGKIRIFINHSGADSITGDSFSSKQGQWERVIDIVADEVRSSQLKTKQRYLKLLDYRRIVLAAQYQREGHPELAQPLCRRAFASFKESMLQRLLIPRLFGRIVAGKRGSARIARMIIK